MLFRSRACLVTSVMSNSGDPMDCGPPGSSVHGILQARILEWVAISFSAELSNGIESGLATSELPVGHGSLPGRRGRGDFQKNKERCQLADTERETIPGEGKVWGDVGAAPLPKGQQQRWPTSLEPWISWRKRQEQTGDSSPSLHPRKQFGLM